ncbi:NAD(P)H-hydrate dehydratase [Rothia sp. SD9660Na]|uniref:ADP-dependent NAD(P)H-hydrate dehydratase n=1 Tax=Rothia sp. SD9660Na TaxID=3047030 RepID=UPI0024BA77E0|nr:ADP/ATP-dependent (S)-NAD(P)H-hydrate dehydratase [Rothia sp. SD9660Na]WHS50988.1 NAD(P)H-hydrate dehydratase [Rothia sp. SD9660Na]
MARTKELTHGDVQQYITSPTSSSHKYTRGVLGLLTGSDTYPGAALMSARAAVNTGVGMVRFAGTSSLNFQVQLTVPEAVCSVGEVEKLHVDAWALGSGIAGEPREAEALAVLAGGQPAVIDAGAISLAARLVADGLELTAHHILTPHTGELVDALTWIFALAPSTLYAVDPELTEPPSREQVEADPYRFTRLLAQATGATVLLKGGTSILAAPTGELFESTGENHWLATAGSGDTLTGILGSLLARYQAEESKPGALSTDYARLAGAAVRVHQLAAGLVHGAGRSGPTPPTLVAQKIPEAVAIFLER